MFQPHLLLYVPTTPPPLCSNHTSSSMFQPHLLLYVPTTPPPLCSNHTSSSMFQPHLLLYVPTTPPPLCSNHTSSSMFQQHLLLYVPTTPPLCSNHTSSSMFLHPALTYPMFCHFFSFHSYICSSSSTFLHNHFPAYSLLHLIFHLHLLLTNQNSLPSLLYSHKVGLRHTY